MIWQLKTSTIRAFAALLLIAVSPLFLAQGYAQAHAQKNSLECRALKCLTSPYGPGMAPSCEKPLQLIKQSVVRGEGLPVCDGLSLNTDARDFSSHWYWRVLGWQSCDKGSTKADHPFACGAAIHETLPDRIDFEIGSGDRLTTKGLQRVERIIGALKSKVEVVTDVTLTAVVMSRENDASEELAIRRNETVRALIQDQLPTMPIRFDFKIENSVVHKPLLHAVNISVKGRGVRPDRSILGLSNSEGTLCGTVEVRPGSVRQIIDTNIKRCGYVIGSWRFGLPAQSQDFIENHNNTVEVGRSIEQVLEYFQSVYGIGSTIDGARIEFKRRN